MISLINLKLKRANAMESKNERGKLRYIKGVLQKIEPYVSEEKLNEIKQSIEENNNSTKGLNLRQYLPEGINITPDEKNYAVKLHEKHKTYENSLRMMTRREREIVDKIIHEHNFSIIKALRYARKQLGWNIEDPEKGIDEKEYHRDYYKRNKVKYKEIRRKQLRGGKIKMYREKHYLKYKHIKEEFISYFKRYKLTIQEACEVTGYKESTINVILRLSSKICPSEKALNKLKDYIDTLQKDKHSK